MSGCLNILTVRISWWVRKYKAIANASDLQPVNQKQQTCQSRTTNKARRTNNFESTDVVLKNKSDGIGPYYIWYIADDGDDDSHDDENEDCN